MLFLRRLSVWMSRCGFRSEDILFKKVLFYRLLQVFPEGPAVDGVVGAVFLRLGERRIVLEWSRAPDLWLIFDSVEDFVDREFQLSEAFHRFVASE